MSGFCRAAGEIYTGEQHVRLMRGVQAMRGSDGGKAKNDVQARILSAGFGVNPESRVVAPYEVTFATFRWLYDNPNPELSLIWVPDLPILSRHRESL